MCQPFARRIRLSYLLTKHMVNVVRLSGQRQEIPNVKQLHFGVIEPVDVVDLGVFFDPQLTMKAHVSAITRTCFYHLRRLRAIRGRFSARLVSCVYYLLLQSILPGYQWQRWHRSSFLWSATRPGPQALGPRDSRPSRSLAQSGRLSTSSSVLIHRVTGQAPSYLSLLTVAADVRGRASLRSSARHKA